jgi:hypothetical protein
MLENAAESRQSTARCVGQFFVVQDSSTDKAHFVEKPNLYVIKFFTTLNRISTTEN